MTDAVQIRIRKTLKDNDIREKLERFSFIITGVVLILSIFEKIPGLLYGSKPLESLHTAASLAAGIFNIFYGILNRRITSENLKEIINRFLFAAAGLLLLIEAYGKFMFSDSKIFIPLFAASLLYFTLSLFYNKIQSLKILKLDDKGISWRTTPFRKQSFLWKDISSIYLEENEVKISLNGIKTYTLSFVEFLSDEEHDKFINAVQKYSSLNGSGMIASSISQN